MFGLLFSPTNDFYVLSGKIGNSSYIMLILKKITGVFAKMKASTYLAILVTSFFS